MAVRLPRVLNSDLSEAFRIRPVEMSITLNLREDSTATITLPDDAQDVPVRTFVELYTPRGSAGIFRVTDTSRNVFNQRVLTLKSGLATLEDSVYRVQEDYEGTVQAFLAAVLGYQTVTRWQLGTVADGSTVYKRSGINYNSIADLIRGLSDDDVDHYFETDYTTTPWTLHYRAVPTTVGCEMRLSRSVRTVQIVRNDAELCTRLYLSVSSDLVETELRTYNDEDAQAVYGIVEKTADVNAADVADPDAWAARYMREHKAPAVQITIDGYELARLTGDSWDEYSLGKLCRVNLSGELLEERVVSVTYPDPLGEPDLVQVQLATKAATASGAIANLVRKSGGGGGGGASGGYATMRDLRNIAYSVDEQVDEIDKLTEMVGHVPSGQNLYDLYSDNADAIGNVPAGQNLYSLHNSNASTISSHTSTLATHTTQIANLKTQVDDNTDEIEKYGSGTTPFKTITITDPAFTFDSKSVSWQSQYVLTSLTITMPSITLSASSNVVTHISGAWDWDHLTAITNARVVTSYTAGSVTGPSGKTLYYLGRQVN